MGRDNLWYSIVGIAIWIAAWQLADLLFKDKSRETQIKIYAAFLVAGIVVFVLMDKCRMHE